MNSDPGKCIIVLGFSVTALSTLRCVQVLKKEGYSIILAGTENKLTIARYSNIPSKKYVFHESLTQGLLGIREELPGKPVLLITQDKDAVEISENRELLEPFFHFLLPTKQLVEILMEKTRFTHFALNEKMPLPTTYFIEDETGLIALKEKDSFPLIVKPYLLHAIKVFSASELEALARKLEPINYKSLIVQEYIEGEDDTIVFCFLLFDYEGKLVHRMIARKLRQWPISYGTTSLAVTETLPELEEVLQQFINSVKMHGYCSIEFKYDSNRKKYFIMEPTIGRFNQQIALSRKAGVNFPLAMVKLLLQQPLHLLPQKDNIYWIYESNDFFSFRNSPKKYGYLRILFRPHIKVLLSFTDPYPFIQEVLSLLKKRFRKIAKHV